MELHTKEIFRNIVTAISLSMVKISNGSASTNYSYQPKEPDKLKIMLKDKK